MPYPTLDWLLEPTFPAAPAVPRLDRELRALDGTAEPSDSVAQPTTQHPPSGTWRVGARPEYEFADDERFATSDAEAPTVRPGALPALKLR